MADFNILVEEALGKVELQELLQNIVDTEKLALRDIKIIQSPREGRFTVVWEVKL